jgi:hypothetical protein
VRLAQAQLPAAGLQRPQACAPPHFSVAARRPLHFSVSVFWTCAQGGHTVTPIRRSRGVPQPQKQP